jgi:hypothetical protein
MHSAIANNELRSSGTTTPAMTPAPQVHAGTRPGPRPIRYGLPCANCRLYYAAELIACPICNCGDRVFPLVCPAAML